MTYSRSVELPVSPDEAFSLVTEPERLRRWQTVSAYVDLRAGGSYRWTVTPAHVAAGTYREVEPGRRVVFGWGWEGNEGLPPDASVVTVTIEPADAGCRVTLVHEGLPPEQLASHAEGWDHYLERLERLASSGDAGPDAWAQAPEPMDPPVAANAVLAALQPVLRRIGPEHDDDPTPCPDFRVRDLVAHLVGSMTHLTQMAGGAAGDPVDGSVENRVTVPTARAVDAWQARGLDGTVPGPGGRPMPATCAAAIVPVELLLHGWDLAVATGQQLSASDEVVTYVADLASDIVPASRAAGAFADPLEPEAEAGPLDRLAAYAGRRR